MVNNHKSDINPSDDLHKWACDITKKRKDSFEYFNKFGSPLEKALCSAVVELSGVVR